MVTRVEGFYYAHPSPPFRVVPDLPLQLLCPLPPLLQPRLAPPRPGRRPILLRSNGGPGRGRGGREGRGGGSGRRRNRTVVSTRGATSRPHPAHARPPYKPSPHHVRPVHIVVLLARYLVRGHDTRLPAVTRRREVGKVRLGEVRVRVRPGVAGRRRVAR